MSKTNLQLLIQNLGADCVQCGLCLPHCPTYHVKQLEAQSPRGRIALAQLLAKNPNILDASGYRALDDCLACGRCEAVCPAQVRYLDMLTATRKLMRDHHGEPWIRRWLRRFAAYPNWVRRIVRIAPQFQGHPTLFALVKNIKYINRLCKIFAAVPRTALHHFQKSIQPSTTKPHVGLLIGCTGLFADNDTVQSSIQVIENIGFSVVVLPANLCCGALALHAGAAEDHQRQVNQLAQAINRHSLTAVVHLNSGCHKALMEHLSPKLNMPIDDICAFTTKNWCLDASRINSAATSFSQETVMAFISCSQRNIDGGKAVKELLQRAGISAQIQFPASGCCGAAGVYFVDHPQISDGLKEKSVAPILTGNPRYVVTNNIGCRLQLQEACAAQAPAIRVVHPITLLAKTLVSDPSTNHVHH